jgi:hypothetical protein
MNDGITPDAAVAGRIRAVRAPDAGQQNPRRRGTSRLNGCFD